MKTSLHRQTFCTDYAHAGAGERKETKDTRSPKKMTEKMSYDIETIMIQNTG